MPYYPIIEKFNYAYKKQTHVSDKWKYVMLGSTTGAVKAIPHAIFHEYVSKNEICVHSLGVSPITNYVGSK